MESATPSSQKFAVNEKEPASVPRHTGLFAGKLYLAVTARSIAGFCRRKIACRRDSELVRAEGDVSLWLNWHDIHESMSLQSPVVRSSGRSTFEKVTEMPKAIMSFVVALVITVSSAVLFAADNKPRTGTTQKFGTGTITNRSDGSSSKTQPFGSGTMTSERDKSGKTVTGTTQKFGTGTITNRSDGSTIKTQPFGSGTITTERDKTGKTVTGTTQKFGTGTITNRSDGSSSKTQPFGTGTITTDKPGKASSFSTTKKK